MPFEDVLSAVLCVEECPAHLAESSTAEVTSTCSPSPVPASQSVSKMSAAMLAHVVGAGSVKGSLAHVSGNAVGWTKCLRSAAKHHSQQ